MLKWLFKNFWPTNEFKDCSIGKPVQRYNAYKYNQKNADILICPILNWAICVFLCYIILYLAQILSKFEPSLIYVVAFFSILMTFSIVGALILTVSYIFLNGCNVSWLDNSVKDSWYN